MPFLTIPFGSEGPLTDIYVALSTPRVDALKKAGLLYPPPKVVTGLVDTGASCSAIALSVVQDLGLVPSGTIQLYSTTTGSHPQTCNLYDVCLAFVQPEVKVIGVTIPVVEANLTNRKFEAIIGRDALEHCLFIYDGKHSTFTLAF